MAENVSFGDTEDLDFDGDDDPGDQSESRRDTEDALAIQLSRTPDQEDTFRPLLADAQKIGFFSLDRATQTEETEIVQIKELTATVEQLLEDSAIMRRDITFARNVMQSEFDAKLQERVTHLYVRTNDSISVLERTHKERVDTIRRAFRQQLADALVRLRNLFNSDLDHKMQKEEKKKNRDKLKLEAKIKQLQDIISHHETVNQMMKTQMHQMRVSEEEARSMAQADRTNNMSSRATSANPAEEKLEASRNDNTKLNKQMDKLLDSIEQKDKEIEEIQRKLDMMSELLDQEKNLSAHLREERKSLEKMAHDEGASTAMAADELLNQQKLEMQRNMEFELMKAREDAYQDAMKKAGEMNGGDQALILSLQDQIRILEQQVNKLDTKRGSSARSKNRPSSAAARDEMSKLEEERMAQEIAKLKREINRVHRTWEKKFAILQQSLHALKDESYLRQTMQKQATQLHQASISYAADGPIGILPNRGGPVTPLQVKRPLPHINRKNQQGDQSAEDYLSYTISAPSGRATTLFSTDENQIMSDCDDGDLPEGFVPLPPPPARFDDSRPSTRSHVVVMPSA